MVSKSKFAALILMAMMGVASPTFAQNLETGTTANTYGWNSPQAQAVPGGSNGLNAFGMVPRARVHSGRHAFGRTPGSAYRLRQPGDRLR